MAPRRNTRTFQSQAHTTPSAERQQGVQGQAPDHEDQEDQEVSQQGGESQVGARQAPPPPAIDLVQVLNNQNILLEALTNVITNPRPSEQSTNDKLTAFLRTKPPTFAGSYNPLDADDWLRIIKRKLEPFEHGDRDKVRLAAHQLTRTALAWWENYCAAAQDASTITWKEFVDEFRRYHIPAATMKRKADEFRELQQGNKSVEEYTYQFIELACYAPEEIDKDEKKQDMFRKGLNAELKKLLSPCIYPDFNTLMNMAIITERAMVEEKRDNKRKFLETKAHQQDRFQKPRHFGPPVTRSQAPMQYRTQSRATGSQAPSTQFRQFKSQNTMKAAQSNASQVTASNKPEHASTAVRQATSLPIAQ
jgi:hypothetical protein